MTKDNILHTIHNVSNSDLMPLSKIQTEEDIERLKKQSYYLPCTYHEWKERFPGINPDHIYFLSGFNCDVIYYDNENLTYLHLIQLLLMNDPKMLSDMTKQIIQAIQRCKDDANSPNPNYIHLLNSYSDGLRIEGLKRIFEKEGPSPRFYETFIAVYTHSDFTVGSLPEPIILALKSSKSEEQNKQTDERIRAKFGDADSFLLYRGATEKSTPVEKALSWTPNINLAYRFACSYGTEPVVLTAVVKKEDIIEYISEDTTIGSEEEFLVLPGKINIQNAEHLLTAVSDEITESMDNTLSVFQTYKQKLKMLYLRYGKDNSYHDALHSLRVLFLGLVLGCHEGLSKAEQKQLAEAAIYHDVGRTNDDTDATHGQKSAELYQRASGFDKAVSFIITNHCIEDSDARVILEKEFVSKTQGKIWRLYEILKDADALDRVRFGIAVDPQSDGLDVRYLRHDYAKKLVSLAIQTERFLTL